jgi:P-type Mg2+ transporter
MRKEFQVQEIVPGDIFILGAGNLVPVDARLPATKDLFVDQATNSL